MVAADLRTATITSFDSFRHRGQPTDIPHTMRPILLRLQAWLTTILPRTPFAAHNGRWQWRQQTCTVQRNAVDCGIHALLNIVKVLTPAWPLLHDEDPAHLRVWMFTAICSRRQYLAADAYFCRIRSWRPKYVFRYSAGRYLRFNSAFRVAPGYRK